jgi:pimeloyl-ACP methyl ester carboxylesterase
MIVRTLYKDARTQTVDVGGTRFAYRQIGAPAGVPVVFLPHWTAVMDDWDPRVIDGIAATRHVITFDNRGVGASEGTTPHSVAGMARDAVSLVQALELDRVDLVGFSLGGFIAQVIAHDHPRLVRKLVLAGTAPCDGTFDGVTASVARGILRGALTLKDPRQHLFFPGTPEGQAHARAFLRRLKERTHDRGKSISPLAAVAQTRAIFAWRGQKPLDLTRIRQPALVVNGDHDVMVPTSNSADLARRLPDARLTLYPDAGHGGVFQCHEEFVDEVLEFLESPLREPSADRLEEEDLRCVGR